MNLQKNSRMSIYLCMMTIVLASASWGAFVLGSKPFNFFDTSWLWHDLAQVYLAWAQFTSDPNSHWLNSSKLSYPLELNFALFDPMPIFLLTIGKLSPLLPDRTQYFGMYFLICLILQGVLGYLILKKITSSLIASNFQKEIYCLLGSFFFILTPFTFYRFQQHTALASHWVILLSIWTCISTDTSKFFRWIFLNGLVLLLATGINPYLTLMVLISQGCFLIFCSRRQSKRNLAFHILLLAVITIFGFKIFGFLSASGVRDFGYGVFSMNVLGPFNSNGLATLFPLHLSDPTNGQVSSATVN